MKPLRIPPTKPNSELLGWIEIVPIFVRVTLTIAALVLCYFNEWWQALFGIAVVMTVLEGFFDYRLKWYRAAYHDLRRVVMVSTGLSEALDGISGMARAVEERLKLALCSCGHAWSSHSAQAGCLGGGRKDCECNSGGRPQ